MVARGCKSKRFGRGAIRAKLVCRIAEELGRNLRDLLPIVCVVALFQMLVVREPMLEVERRIEGAVFALV
jgi:hypothetical protein